MKIQPIDFNTLEEVAPARFETVKPVMKSRFKRLFERQFSNVLRNSGTEKVADELPFNKECAAEFEPSSVCLATMVQNFIEENNEKQQSGAVRCSRSRCNCFNRNCCEGSEDEMDGLGFGEPNLTYSGEASEILKSLVYCARKLLLMAYWPLDMMLLSANLIGRNPPLIPLVCSLSLGYDASICKSHWEKSPSYPAGEYEYIDVIIDGERLLIDIDFKSEFEIVRSTTTYKSILQMLPFIFVGKADRLQKIIAIVSEAVKQSLKKKGMPIPPWRKAEYVESKWLSPHNRTTPSPSPTPTSTPTPTPTIETPKEFEFETVAKEKSQPLFEFNPEEKEDNSVEESESGESIFALSESFEEEGKEKVEKEEWKPPEIKPKSSLTGAKIVTDLASLIEDEPRKF
ncbi:hypothetical protein V6N13_137872 [Hibiscus sabdariffa]